MTELAFRLMHQGKRPTVHLATTVTLNAGESVKCMWSYEHSWIVHQLWLSGGPFLIRAPFITGAAAADFYSCESDDGKGMHVGYDVKVTGASADLTVEIIAENFGLDLGPRTLHLVMETCQ
jgi:hypothetical protein